MESISGHLLDWIIFALLILGAIYTMMIIGKEKKTFKDEAYDLQFGEITLPVPRWWTQTDELNQQNAESWIRFERTDTRYDWFAMFHFIPGHKDTPLEKLLADKLLEEDITYDQEEVQIETDSRVLFRDPESKIHFQEVIRVEGTATQKIIERIYYDIYLIRGLNEDGYFIFESRSSVLNGSLEGPFFEECISELRFIHEPKPDLIQNA